MLHENQTVINNELGLLEHMSIAIVAQNLKRTSEKNYKSFLKV